MNGTGVTSPAAVTLDAIVRWFETLSRESVRDTRAIYTEDAEFKDPFNTVKGVARIERIFAHMFDQVGDPRFIVHERFVAGGAAMLVWDFVFRMRGRDEPVVVRGVSHLRLAADGRIAWHRDYWDVAEELYEKMPVLGGFMRFLKRRLAAGE